MDERIQRAEKRIREAIALDRSNGYELIAGATHQVLWEDSKEGSKKHLGRCALAMTVDPGDLDQLAYRMSNMFDWTRSEMMAFIKAWDGERSCDPMPFWELGNRLRKEFKPRDV